MSDRESYRDWARSVRSAARQSIKGLRAERLARRSSQGTAIPSAIPSVADDLPISISSSTASLLELDAASKETGFPLGSYPQASDTRQKMPETFATEELRDSAEESTVEGCPPDLSPRQPEAAVAQPGPTHNISEICTEGSDDAAPVAFLDATDAVALTPCLLAAPEDSPMIASQADARSAPPDCQQDLLCGSSLTALPGAGTGLIWLLHVNGISSLRDLAQADARTLSSALGLVGQLIDVQDWIDFAVGQLQEEVPERGAEFHSCHDGCRSLSE